MARSMYILSLSFDFSIHNPANSWTHHFKFPTIVSDKRNFRFWRYYVINIFKLEYFRYLLSHADQTGFGERWMTVYFLKNIFYVTSGLVDMPSLKFQLRISFLFYVGFRHNLVTEIWVVHMTLRSYKISCEIEGHVDLWSQLKGKCIFFLYRLICQFITQSILDRITPNFQVWSLKAKEKYRGMLRGESSGCKGITSSIFFNGDMSCTIGLSSNMLKENQIKDLHLYLNMICDIIILVFNKMEETFQSNTLDWSSLVIKVSDFSRKPFCFRFVFY